jgi:hypothetical protein
MKPRGWILRAIAVAAVIAACIGVRQVSRPTNARASVASAVQQVALNQASLMGENNPTGVTYVPSTRVTAVEAISGDVLASDDARPVYVVTMDGSFVDSMAFVPEGSPPPKGTHLTLVLDATNLSVLDLSLTPTEPPLAKLGVPTVMR